MNVHIGKPLDVDQLCKTLSDYISLKEFGWPWEND